MKATTIISFCLLVWSGQAHETSLTGSLDIVQKGKHCVEVAESVVEATSQNLVDEAIEDLRSLEAENQHLAKHAQSTVDLLGVTQSESHAQLESTQLEIGKLGRMEIDLKQQIARSQATLEHEQSMLVINQEKIQEENRALDHAKRKLKDAKKDAKEKRTVGAILGGAIGLFTGGLGAGIGGAIAGTVGAEIINELEGDVDKASSRVRNAERAFAEAQNAVSQTQRHISDLGNQMNVLSTQIESKKQESNRKHEEEGKIRKAITFQRRAAEFWRMFLESTENAGDETTTLQQIVTIAKEKKDWDILRSDGTKLIQASFLEAWEEVESSAKMTGSYYSMFLVE